jgi:hypothetical protein
MRNEFAAVAVLMLPLTLAFTDRAQAQNDDVQGWDILENAELVVPGVATRIKFGKIGTVVRDVHVDCDLLKQGRTQDGKPAVFLTPAFFAQFNAESESTWQKLPENVRQVLERSRRDMSISKPSIDGIKGHLEIEHGIKPATVVQAGQRCKAEHFGL